MAAPLPAAQGTAPALTPVEQRVLQHLAAGHPRRAIAGTEQLTLRETERVIRDLHTKLAAPTAFILGMKAVQLGLLP